MKKYLLVTVLGMALVSSCSITTSANSSENTSNSIASESTSSGNSDSKKFNFDYGNDDFKEFFSKDSKVEIELNFKNESLYRLAQYGVNDFTHQEMYHPCDVKIVVNSKETVFKDVACRMKGNTSRNNNFIDSNGYFTSKERLCHFKLAFDKTFDSPKTNDYYIKTYTDSEKEEIDKRRLFSMKKLDLKWNKNYDVSFTKELYALDCFREENVISQHGNLVNLKISTEVDEVTMPYLAYEVIDKTLLKNLFDKEAQKGDLYKCCYTSAGKADLTETNASNTGEESNSFSPTYEIKTNEDTTNHESLSNFITKLGVRNVDADTIKKDVDELVDVDNFLRFAAMSYIVGSPDDYRNNYNNYYLYFDSSTNKAYFLPYDNDRVFGIKKDWPIDTSNQEMCSDRLTGTATNDGQGTPLVRRTIVPGSKTRPIIEEYQNIYKDYCREFAAKYLNVERFKEYTSSFYYSSKTIDETGENMSFKDYALNKNNAISRG